MLITAVPVEDHHFSPRVFVLDNYQGDPARLGGSGIVSVC